VNLKEVFKNLDIWCYFHLNVASVIIVIRILPEIQENGHSLFRSCSKRERMLKELLFTTRLTKEPAITRSTL